MGSTVQDLLTSGDSTELGRLLAAEVAFHSPVADYTGHADVAHLLSTIARCLSDVAPGHEFADGPHRIGEFTARVAEHAVDGVLKWQVGPDGLVVDATLLLRPLAALREAVAMMRDALAAQPLPSRR